MDIRTMTHRDVRDTIQTLEQRFSINVTNLAIAVSRTYFVIFTTDSCDVNTIEDFRLELDCICMGIHDISGNEIATEAEVSASCGFVGAMVLAAASDEQFRDYCMIAIDAKPEQLCKDGVWYE